MGHQPVNFGKRAILLLFVFLAFVSIWTSRTLASNTDKDAGIQDTILRQIEAFANNDPEQAWALASEGIQRRFGSSQVFLDMVRLAYPAVHNATAIEFSDRVPHDGFQIQVVKLKGPEGERWDVYYRMVLTEDVWKIAGVRLQPAEPGI